MNCGPNWKLTNEENEALKTQWEPLLKHEGTKQSGYAHFSCVMSTPQGSNPPCMALVNAADDWCGGHFGGVAVPIKTENGREYYQVKVYID